MSSTKYIRIPSNPWNIRFPKKYKQRFVSSIKYRNDYRASDISYDLTYSTYSVYFCIFKSPMKP